MSTSNVISSFKEKDMEPLVKLVNSAYRGEVSRKGWTTEADIIDGNVRIDGASIKEMLSLPGAIILTYQEDDILLGCIYLKSAGNGLYLGMFSVSPEAQGMGIGKKLLKAAEDHAAKNKYQHIEMTVIDIRYELIAWYEKYGYTITGETQPFPDDGRFGNPLKPIEFVVLKKIISAKEW